MSLFKIEETPIEEIKITNRSRQVFEDIEELASSIEANGLLIPILITEDKTLLAGERRIRAFKHLEQDTIPARILTGISPSDYEVIEYVENYDRNDFKWHEELEIKLKMHTKWSESHTQWGYRKTAD